MNTLTNLSLQSLAWKQPSIWRRGFILESAAGEIGSLAFTSAWREVAEAECAGQVWTFDRTGFFKQQVLAWRYGEEDPQAVYHPHTWRGGGTLELVDGRSFEFEFNFWQTRFEVRAAGGESCVVFYERGFLRQTVDVEVQPAVSGLDVLPLLICLGMYLILLKQNDGAAAGAVVAATA